MHAGAKTNSSRDVQICGHDYCHFVKMLYANSSQLIAFISTWINFKEEESPRERWLGIRKLYCILIVIANLV